MSRVMPTLEPPSEMRWYMSGVAAYFFAGGIQSVVFPWLLVFVLDESSERVGIAQMFSMLPLMLLAMFGGAKADRSELRLHLLRLQLIAAAIPLLLMTILLAELLTYEVMLAYAVILSALGAFTMPARDSLLTRVLETQTGGDIQKAVAASTSAQFMSQVAGLMLGGAALVTGAPALLACQSLSLLGAAYTTYHLSPAPAAHTSARPSGMMARLDEIREGLVLVWQNDRIRPVLIIMFLGGVLFIGVFMVLFPILVRDVYGGDSLEVALINVCFFGGIGLSSWVQMRLPSIKRQGRAIMLSFFSGSTVMVCLHFEPPIWAVFLLVMGWGLGSGVSMSQSRAIVQAAAGTTHRARILAAFQLGMMGGGPLGAFGAGYAIEWLGPLNAALIPASCMVFVWSGMFFFSRLWQIEATPLQN